MSHLATVKNRSVFPCVAVGIAIAACGRRHRPVAESRPHATALEPAASVRTTAWLYHFGVRVIRFNVAPTSRCARRAAPSFIRGLNTRRVRQFRVAVHECVRRSTPKETCMGDKQ